MWNYLELFIVFLSRLVVNLKSKDLARLVYCCVPGVSACHVVDAGVLLFLGGTERDFYSWNHQCSFLIPFSATPVRFFFFFYLCVFLHFLHNSWDSYVHLITPSPPRHFPFFPSVQGYFLFPSGYFYFC